jgi:hypothetical protein
MDRAVKAAADQDDGKNIAATAHSFEEVCSALRRR